MKKKIGGGGRVSGPAADGGGGARGVGVGRGGGAWLVAMTETGLEPTNSGLVKPALLSTRLNTIIAI